jgi:hypothetical protein
MTALSPRQRTTLPCALSGPQKLSVLALPPSGYDVRSWTIEPS